MISLVENFDQKNVGIAVSLMVSIRPAKLSDLLAIQRCNLLW